MRGVRARVVSCGWVFYLLSDVVSNIVIFKGEHQLIAREHQLLLSHAAAKLLRPKKWMLEKLIIRKINE